MADSGGTQIQVRRNTAAGAAASNPTLAQGEPGLETDTGYVKIGDGATSWNRLPYAAGSNTARQFSLRGNRRISEMRSASVMANPPTVGPYSAGYSSGDDIAAAESGGYGITTAIAIKVSYGAPNSDKHFRIRGGPYQYINGNTAADMGAVQSIAPSGIGFTAKAMHASFDWQANTGHPLLIRMRDTSVVPRLIVWMGVDGAPLQPHVAVGSPQSLAPPGDNKYHLLPISCPSAGSKYTVLLELESGNFGGVCIDVGDAITYPTLGPARTLMVIGDSYVDIGNATGGATPCAAGYATRLARALGMDLFTSSYGGTGFSATDGGPGYNYAERIPLEVTPAAFAPPDLALIFVQGSINDGLVGFAGTDQLNTDIKSTFTQLQVAFPGVPLVTSMPMHPYRGSSVDNGEDVTVGNQIATVAAELGIPAPIDPVGYGLLTGTGYQGHLVGDGTSDYFSYSDHQHYSPAAGKALGDLIASEIVSLFGLQLA
jgi:Major tropism determinant N-terminal domain